MFEIDERQKKHHVLQSELAMYKAPQKVRKLVQSISQEQIIALNELIASTTRNHKATGREILGFLAGHVKEIDNEIAGWICEIK